MMLFQTKMKNVSEQIECSKPPQWPPRQVVLKELSKEDLIRGVQPRSSKCKKTLQTFKKKKRTPVYQVEEFKPPRKELILGNTHQQIQLIIIIKYIHILIYLKIN